jgi:hypothetical protein
MNNNKQITAVEWYKNELNRIELSYMNKVIDRKEYMDLKSQAFEQAKELEKQQIMKAVYDSMGTNFDPNMGRAEQYYNETYKSE